MSFTCDHRSMWVASVLPHSKNSFPETTVHAFALFPLPHTFSLPTYDVYSIVLDWVTIGAPTFAGYPPPPGR